MIILVIGASSFLGHHVIPKLQIYAENVRPANPVKGVRRTPRFTVLTPSSKELNLLDYNNVLDYFKNNKFDTILHMAAKCGGIGANKDNPAVFLHDNLKMSLNLFDAIKEVNEWEHGSKEICPKITHFYGLGSVCSYPQYCPVPFKEDDLWNGFPEKTNSGYGHSKRTLLMLQKMYRIQYGLKGAHLLPANLFGEWDHFDLRNSHVIPALINKFVTAKTQEKPTVFIWGDGTPTREFLYAGDCSEAICRVVSGQKDYDEPINIGTGKDISIHNLAYLLKELIGFKGEIQFLRNGVNGQPERRLDVSRAKHLFNFEAKTDLKDGLEKTIRWYMENDGAFYKEQMKEDDDNLAKKVAEVLIKKSNGKLYMMDGDFETNSQGNLYMTDDFEANPLTYVKVSSDNFSDTYKENLLRAGLEEKQIEELQRLRGCYGEIPVRKEGEPAGRIEDAVNRSSEKRKVLQNKIDKAREYYSENVKHLNKGNLSKRGYAAVSNFSQPSDVEILASVNTPTKAEIQKQWAQKHKPQNIFSRVFSGIKTSITSLRTKIGY